MSDESLPPAGESDAAPEIPVESESAARPGPRRWPLGALTVIAVAAIAIGVVLFRDPGNSPATTTTATLGGFAVPTGDTAPEFVVELLDGTRFVLANELAAGRPVVLNLWASWCTPCRAEMPAIDAAAQAHPEVSFIGVAVEDDPTAARDFALEIGVTYPLAIDESGSISRLYPSPGLPTTFLIATNGRIAQVLYGGVDEDQIATAIAEVFAG